MSNVRWKFFISACLLGNGLAGFILLVEIVEHTASQREKRWFGHVASLEGIILISLLIGVLHSIAVRRAKQTTGDPQTSIPGILVGADNRLSTSKLSAFAWTWVLGWAMLSLAVADWVGAPGGWKQFLDQGLQDEYLVLLGGPFVALVGAKALVTSAVERGALVKLAAGDEETKLAERVSQAFSDDTGQTDLLDTQYLLFGAITLLVFIVMFIRESWEGLPSLPELLIGLSTLGATAFIANKWTAKDAKPRIDQIVPESAKEGDEVVIYGSNLLTVSVGGKRTQTKEPMKVLFGSLVEQDVSPTASQAVTSASGSDWVKLTVPKVPDAAWGTDKTKQAPIVVRNAIGVTSENNVPFTIERA